MWLGWSFRVIYFNSFNVGTGTLMTQGALLKERCPVLFPSSQDRGGTGFLRLSGGPWPYNTSGRESPMLLPSAGTRLQGCSVVSNRQAHSRDTRWPCGPTVTSFFPEPAPSSRMGGTHPTLGLWTHKQAVLPRPLWLWGHHLHVTHTGTTGCLACLRGSRDGERARGLNFRKGLLVPPAQE